MTTIFIKDSQSRITRYGLKCFQLIDGIKCQAFAHATKKGNNLIISNNFNDCFESDNKTVIGVYKIIKEEHGRIANVICEKL